MENIIEKIAACCGILAFIYLFIKKVIKGESWKSKLIEEATRNNHFVEATCIDTKFYWGDDECENTAFKYNTMRVKYEYEVNGKKYYKKLSFQSPGMINVDYPRTITVYYKENNPKKAVCKNELPYEGNVGCVIAFIAMLVTQIIVVKLLKIFLL